MLCGNCVQYFNSSLVGCFHDHNWVMVLVSREVGVLSEVKRGLKLLIYHLTIDWIIDESTPKSMTSVDNLIALIKNFKNQNIVFTLYY